MNFMNKNIFNGYSYIKNRYLRFIDFRNLKFIDL